MPRSKSGHTAQVPYALAVKLKGSEAALTLDIPAKTAAHWRQTKLVPAARVIRELIARADGARPVQHPWEALGIPEMETISTHDHPVILNVWRALARLKAAKPEQFDAISALIAKLAQDLPPIGGSPAQTVRLSAKRQPPSPS